MEPLSQIVDQGLFWASLLIKSITGLSCFCRGLVLVGFGIGLFRSPNASSVMGSVPASKRGISSAVRVTIINTSIVASIPLVLALMTVDVPYNKLISIIGNSNLVMNAQASNGSLAGFLLGLQHALLVFSGIILVSAVFSLLRGSISSARSGAEPNAVSYKTMA